MKRSKNTFRPRLEVLEVRAVPAVFADFNGDGFDDLAVGVLQANDSAHDAGAVHVIYGSAEGLTADNAEVFTQDSLGLDSEDHDHFGLALAAGDFNGDGLDDLAVGTPGEDTNSGAVYVLYGSVSGLGAETIQMWTQNSPGILDQAEASDNFGRSLAAGDFNGDGKDDLAIGVPNEKLGGAANAGAVNVVYGTANGLSATNNQFWTQNSAGILDVAEANDQFGAALAVGDFNGDGKDDLAIGVPNESLGQATEAGAVNVLYGSGARLSAAKNQFWTQNSYGIADVAESGDRFGASLAVGDFNGDGKDDLTIGVPFEDVGAAANAGAVNVIYGKANGLSATNNQFWTQNSPGIVNDAEQDDFFGASLAAGDFNGDGKDDLAIGVPGEDAKTGAVQVLYGSANRLSSAGQELWRQTSFDRNDLSVGSRFGSALAVGDYNGDGKADLAIGIPFIKVSEVKEAGAVRVLYGTPGGLSSETSQLWTQFALGIFGEPEDRFGQTL